MATSPRFWNWISKSYSNNPVADQASYARKLEQTQAVVRPDWQMLEVGCGTGTTAITNAPFLEIIHAIDFSPKMIDIAKARAAEAGVSNVTFEVGTLESIDANARYDAIAMHSLLHLLPNWKEAIQRAYDLCEPGGVFISSSSCLRGPEKILAPIFTLLSPLNILPRVVILTQEKLHEEIVKAGFEIEIEWRAGDEPNPSGAVFIIARKPLG
ncbi:MAG: ubiquinone/menaquinone biosynthesis C-methylase UbiE [Halocynthiibacter sp.]|jgi:ubiquinone/menaquinone biosynthesis C-methylase UbiE